MRGFARSNWIIVAYVPYVGVIQLPETRGTNLTYQPTLQEAALHRIIRQLFARAQRNSAQFVPPAEKRNY